MKITYYYEDLPNYHFEIEEEENFDVDLFAVKNQVSILSVEKGE